jgi:serine/threonine protein kinase
VALKTTRCAGESKVWILFADSQEQFLAAMASLSRQGALRMDFLEEFSSPCGQEVIGKGACSSVQRMYQRNGTHVAVKHILPGVDLDGVEREVSMLIKCHDHQHVVGFLGIFWEINQKQLLIAMQIALYGDLLQKVVAGGCLSESASRPIVAGILKGLSHIHSLGIVHRDIKTENILLKSDGCAIISDFGLATLVNDETQMKRRCGSPGFVAPEMCKGQSYDNKVDIFGVGVLFYFVLSKTLPFTSPDGDVKATMRLTVKCEFPIGSLTFARPLKKLLRVLMAKDAKERVSAKDALQHEFFSQESKAEADVDKIGRKKMATLAQRGAAEAKLKMLLMCKGAPPEVSSTCSSNPDRTHTENCDGASYASMNSSYWSKDVTAAVPAVHGSKKNSFAGQLQGSGLSYNMASPGQEVPDNGNAICSGYPA